MFHNQINMTCPVVLQVTPGANHSIVTEDLAYPRIVSPCVGLLRPYLICLLP